MTSGAPLEIGTTTGATFDPGKETLTEFIVRDAGPVFVKAKDSSNRPVGLAFACTGADGWNSTALAVAGFTTTVNVGTLMEFAFGVNAFGWIEDSSAQGSTVE